MAGLPSRMGAPCASLPTGMARGILRGSRPKLTVWKSTPPDFQDTLSPALMVRSGGKNPLLASVAVPVLFWGAGRGSTTIFPSMSALPGIPECSRQSYEYVPGLGKVTVHDWAPGAPTGPISPQFKTVLAESASVSTSGPGADGRKTAGLSVRICLPLTA